MRTSLQRPLVALGVLGAALIALAAILIFSSDHMDDRGLYAALVCGLMAIWIGTGLFAWWRRPHNRIGMLMTATGFAGFFQALTASDAPVFFGIGLALGAAYLAVAVHMVLAFPSGRLTTRAQRALILGTYAVALPSQVLFTLFTADCDCGDGPTPRNGLLITDAPTVSDVVSGIGSLVAVIVVGGAAVMLVRRFRAGGPRERRAFAPVLLTGAVLGGLIAAMLVAQIVAGQEAAQIVSWATLAAFAAVPFAFLTGLLRTRAWRAGAVTEVVEALGEAPARGALRDALADALGDPTLELAYWLPDTRRYVDPAGRTVRLPAEDEPGRAATEVEREGRRVGALVHDAALRDEPELLRALAVAAALALDNERLDAELRARVDDLQRSRERLVEATIAERRRLERDLHDGAQQRLVSLSLQLSLLATKLGDPDAARELLDAARGEARAALEDLRELARGIHPAVLTDRGLGPALEALADRAPVPVEVASVPEERLPEPVEAAAYFVVAESLTNVAKYAGASHAEVRVGRESGWALVEVSDDGVGGADPAAGTGLRGLADRLAALDGRLEIESETGRGTTVRARVPCA